MLIPEMLQRGDLVQLNKGNFAKKTRYRLADAEPVDTVKREKSKSLVLDKATVLKGVKEKFPWVASFNSKSPLFFLCTEST